MFGKFEVGKFSRYLKRVLFSFFGSTNQLFQLLSSFILFLFALFVLFRSVVLLFDLIWNCVALRFLGYLSLRSNLLHNLLRRRSS